METKYFEDFQDLEGETFSTAGRTVTEADFVNFAGLANEFHPVHMDAEYAATTDYGERIASGPLVFSIAVGLMLDIGFLEESAEALYGFDHVRFPTPVFIDDTVSATCTIGGTEDLERFEGGRVTFEMNVQNQHDEVVLSYDHLTIVGSHPG